MNDFANKLQKALDEQEQTRSYFHKKFPKLFTKDTRFEVPRGWEALVERLFNDIKQYNVPVTTLKEKFGKLRVYLDNDVKHKLSPEEQADLYAEITEAEANSASICQICSSVGSLDDRFSCIQTLCTTCKLERN